MPQKISALPPGRRRAPLGCRWVFKGGKEIFLFGTILLFGFNLLYPR
jgi:hypothetical protein